jgi:hypothetical protein
MLFHRITLFNDKGIWHFHHQTIEAENGGRKEKSGNNYGKSFAILHKPMISKLTNFRPIFQKLAFSPANIENPLNEKNGGKYL